MLKKLFATLIAFSMTMMSFNSHADIFASDLEIFLIHNQDTVQLFQGDQNDDDGDLWTTFDDESLNAAVGTPPYPMNMQSFELLSLFDGSDINGTWELQILDDYVPDEGDQLVSWSIWGTYVTGAQFSFDGLPAFDVDTDPATSSFLEIADFGEIADLNVSLHLTDIPEPATIMLLGLVLGFLSLRQMRPAKIR